MEDKFNHPDMPPPYEDEVTYSGHSFLPDPIFFNGQAIRLTMIDFLCDYGELLREKLVELPEAVPFEFVPISLIGSPVPVRFEIPKVVIETYAGDLRDVLREEIKKVQNA